MKTFLSKHLFDHNLLPVRQFAYRKNHSTGDALVSAVDRWLAAKADHKTTGVVTVDMSKAFDRVQHARLLDVVLSIGIGGMVFQLLIGSNTKGERDKSIALVSAVDRWLAAKADHKTTGVVTVDMSKAFDRVQHARLLDVVLSIGIGGMVFQLLIGSNTKGERDKSIALVSAVDRWLAAKADHKTTGVVTVDMSKAFDRVQHARLLDVVLSIGIGGMVFQLLIGSNTKGESR